MCDKADQIISGSFIVVKPQCNAAGTVEPKKMKTRKCKKTCQSQKYSIIHQLSRFEQSAIFHSGSQLELSGKCEQSAIIHCNSITKTSCKVMPQTEHCFDPENSKIVQHFHKYNVYKSHSARTLFTSTM